MLTFGGYLLPKTKEAIRDERDNYPHIHCLAAFHFLDRQVALYQNLWDGSELLCD